MDLLFIIREGLLTAGSDYEKAPSSSCVDAYSHCETSDLGFQLAPEFQSASTLLEMLDLVRVILKSR